MKKLELYAYSTKIYLQAGKIKVGHCEVGRHEERIKEQFGTSNPEQPIYKLIGELPEGKCDHHIHELLLKNGCRKITDAPGREWFICQSKDPFDDVRCAYNQIKYGSPRSKNFSLRHEQKEAVEKACRWFREQYHEEVLGSATHRKRFLINAKMRYGKCFTSMHIAKELQVLNTLIITYKPEVIGEWMDCVNDHVAFNNWTAVRAKKNKHHPADPYLTDIGDFPKTKKHRVLCVSLQDLDIDAEGETKKRLHNILAINWGLVIFDEVHYGGRTDRVNHTLNNLKFQQRLDLSGTPFRLIEQDDFCPQQVYTYSYLDEQKNKKQEHIHNKKENIYQQMPDLNISVIEITDEDIKEQRETFKTDDIDFSLNRLFETNNGEFIHEDAVDNFLQGLWQEGHDARAVSIFGKLAQHLGCPTHRHTVWWLKRVDSAKALAKKLRHHPYFGKFIIIDASGSDKIKDNKADNKIIARDKNKVEQAIKDATTDSSKLGTITLTCGRFLTGVTIKEWDSILILNDTNSAETYFQAIFRVQSPWVVDGEIKKTTAWVFDFAITRSLLVVYTLASSVAEQVEQQKIANNVNDYTNEERGITENLCDSFRHKCFYEGSLESIKTTADKIFQALEHGEPKVALARKITSDVLVNFSSLKQLEKYPEILDILEKIKGYRTQNVGSISSRELVQIGKDAEDFEEIKRDPNISTDDKEHFLEDYIEKDKNKERQTRKRWYATQIKRLSICMADFIYMTYEREYNIDHVIYTKSPKFFNIMTGITKEDFTKLCQLKFMNKEKLNEIVRTFRHQEETSLSPEEFIFNNIVGE